MKQDRELVGTKYNERGRERARFKGYVVECICLTNESGSVTTLRRDCLRVAL